MQRKISWNANGIVVCESTDGLSAQGKELFIPNSKLFELADRITSGTHKNKVGCTIGIGELHGAVLLEIDSDKGLNRKQYQVYCNWMPRWHFEHIDCSLDISYQDDGREMDRVLMVVVRKKFKHGMKSLTKIYRDCELNNFLSSCGIKAMAEDALAKLDSQNKEK
jgi:hypothetical protein